MYNTICYSELNKPFLTPPAWVFPPVWIILYALIFAALIVYTIKCKRCNKLKGYVVFVLQMLFNLLWSPVFFALNNISLALGIVIILDILVFLNIYYFSKVSRTSGILLLPYFLWICFATYLNLMFLVLN